MISYYIIACVPILIGGVLAYFNKKVSWQEWATGSVIAVILAFILHMITLFSMTSDVQTLSGKVVSAIWYPEYVEEYQEAIYYTKHHSSGFGENRRTWTTRHFSHYETRHRTHTAYGACTFFYGNESENHSVNKVTFDDIANKFGQIVITKPAKQGFDGGDPNVYEAKNTNKVIISTVTQKNWDNKVRACPSSFSFNKVNDKVPVFPYPVVNNVWQSNRLIGDAANRINITEFDKMNTRIALTKKANVIIVGFNSADSSLGTQQRDKWLGGKKNDIVICYGYAPLEENKSVVVWVKAFGWTRDPSIFKNLEGIFQDYEINNTILPFIEKEIMTNYIKKDWSEIDLIKVQPSNGWLLFYCIFVFSVQCGLYVYFLNSGFND
jgi:hypothetical protein